MEVLIIEDNRINLQLMAYLLQVNGISVTTATDGKRGLELAALLRPDLIICDVCLPGMDGFQVASALKAQPNLLHIPLVAVTGLATASDRERLLQGGFDYYISKPIEPDNFAAFISAMIFRRKGIGRVIDY